jgi:hypothetical protein
MNALVGFVSVFSLGLVSGVSFSHLLQHGPKAALPAAQFLAVQQVLLRNYGPVVGALETAAFLSTLAMAIVTWREPWTGLLASLAAACALLMILIWAVWIDPINKTINSWTPESLPPTWTLLRGRWHVLHTIRLGLSTVAFSAAIAGAAV